jgi:hypothetical protein
MLSSPFQTQLGNPNASIANTNGLIMFMELITVYSANLCSYFFTLNGQVLKLKEQI